MKLKPCPVCGPESPYNSVSAVTMNVVHKALSADGRPWVQVSCSDCKVSGPREFAFASAVAAWNAMPRKVAKKRRARASAGESSLVAWGTSQVKASGRGKAGR